MMYLLVRWKRLLLQAALLIAISSNAIAQDQLEQAPDAETEDTAAQEQEISDVNESEVTEEEPNRFIPTEQVSQDLGVSFPSNI